MSELRVTRCDGCGDVYPDPPEEILSRCQEGWTQVLRYSDNDYETLDYCRECSEKMLKVVE